MLEIQVNRLEKMLDGFELNLNLKGDESQFFLSFLDVDLQNTLRYK